MFKKTLNYDSLGFILISYQLLYIITSILTMNTNATSLVLRPTIFFDPDMQLLTYRCNNQRKLSDLCTQ